MKSIIFGFSRPRKWKPFAALIMAWDRTKFSHGYARFRSDRWDSDFIYQSSGHRTNFMGGEYFNDINVSVHEYSITVPEHTEAKVGHLCVEREGEPYPIMTVIGIGIVKFFSLIGVRAENPWPSKKRNCIGEQAELLMTGLEIFCPLDFNKATPKEFHDWLLTLPNIQKIEVKK